MSAGQQVVVVEMTLVGVGRLQVLGIPRRCVTSTAVPDQAQLQTGSNQIALHHC